MLDAIFFSTKGNYEVIALEAHPNKTRSPRKGYLEGSNFKNQVSSFSTLQPRCLECFHLGCPSLDCPHRICSCGYLITLQAELARVQSSNSHIWSHLNRKNSSPIHPQAVILILPPSRISCETCIASLLPRQGLLGGGDGNRKVCWRGQDAHKCEEII